MAHALNCNLHLNEAELKAEAAHHGSAHWLTLSLDGREVLTIFTPEGVLAERLAAGINYAVTGDLHVPATALDADPIDGMLAALRGIPRLARLGVDAPEAA